MSQRDADSTATSRELLFWSWFQENEEGLFRAADWHDPGVTQLSVELAKVHGSLRFELSSEEGGKRQLVLSAGGLKELMPYVDRLASAAPPLPRWEIRKYCPRRSLSGGHLLIGGEPLDPGTVRFVLHQEPRRIGITLLFQGASPTDEESLAQAGFFLLDAALGELIVMTCVGSVSFATLPPGTEEGTPYELLWPTFSSRADAMRRGTGVEDNIRALRYLIDEWWLEVADADLEGEELVCELEFHAPRVAQAVALAQSAQESFGNTPGLEEETSILGHGFLVRVRTEVPVFESIESLQGYIGSMCIFAASSGATLSSFGIKRQSEAEYMVYVTLMARELVGVGRFGEGISCLERGLRKLPDNPDLLGLLAYTLAKGGDPERARKYLAELERVIAPSDPYVAVRWNTACSYALLGESDRALRFLREAVTLDRALISAAQSEPDLTALKNLKDYQELIAS